MSKKVQKEIPMASEMEVC